MEKKIISPSPLQGDDVNDARDVIYLSSDDSDHEETNEVVNKTYPPVKWASMWPGIGCGEWGYKQAFGSDPSFIIPSPTNDGDVCERYLEQLFPASRVGRYTQETCPRQKLDVMTVMCPCSGLSGMNNSTGAMKAGEDAKQNEHMVDTLKFILRELAPKVVLGENAERLNTETGAKIKARMVEVGREHGYSATFFSTCTTRHGIPQRRRRTFYLFWEAENAPILEWKNTQPVALGQYLAMVRQNASLQDTFVNDSRLGMKPTDFPLYKFLLERLNKQHGDKLEVNGPPCGRKVLGHLARLGLLQEALASLGDVLGDWPRYLLLRRIEK